MLSGRLALGLIAAAISPGLAQAGSAQAASARAASAQASSAVAQPALAAAPTPQPGAAVPPELLALEQKMLALQITSEKISGTVSISGSLGGPSGPLGGFGKSAAARAAAAVALITVSGEEAFAPPAANLQVSVLGLSITARLIGSTLYIKEPFASRLDGGRPWIEQPNADLEQATGPELAALGGQPGSGAERAFGSLIEEINRASAITDLGAQTIDGQPVSVFRGSIAIGAIGNRTAKQAHTLAKLVKPVAQIEVFLAEDGLPVRTVVTLTLRGRHRAELITQSDILATNAPVVVVAPPPDQTITQAEFKRLERRELQRLLRRVQRRRGRK